LHFVDIEVATDPILKFWGTSKYLTYLSLNMICHIPERFRITSQIDGNSIPSRQSSRPVNPSSIVERGMRQM